MTEIALYFAIGRLVIWLLQIAGPLEKLWQLHPKLRELRECDLCLGFWVYTALALWFRFNWLPDVMYIPVLSEALTGGAASFIMHLIRLGWSAKFGVIVVGQEK